MSGDTLHHEIRWNVENLEELALGVSKRQGSGLQVLDVALED